MKWNLSARRNVLRAAAASALTVTALGAAGAGCLNRPVEPIEPRTTSTVIERLVQSSVDKIDILLAIDNSRSMADKQNILIKAVPDLVKGLVNPKCVDDKGIVAAKQPTDPTQDCPAGFKRDFQPVLDIHIGVVTSSLGGHGADACPEQVKDACDSDLNFTNDDHGHLVSRADVYEKSVVPTYGTKSDKGFLAWDPSQKLTPKGEKSIDNLNKNLTTIVTGLGQIGCGFESQLESWYRFLVDPEPYQTISVVGGKATPKDIDKSLMQQRADFLRSDSLLAVIMLTDENDTSIKEYNQFYLAAQLENADKTAFHLPPGRAECTKKGPDDACCKSCGQSAGDCPKDPTCDKGNLDDTTDPINLRGWDNKRRFGIDFLYPIDRYVQALTSVQVANRKGELVPNPIFSNLNPQSTAGVRDASLVFVAGIVGLPWQDIARKNAKGQPDLLAGLDGAGKPVGGFKSSDELSTADPKSKLSPWDIILGKYDGSDYQPKDPLMKQAVNPRTGQNPVTGDALQPPGSAVGANPINGHEHDVTTDGDLQYACIFPLLKGSERDCTKTCTPSCDCQDKTNKNPLCDANPGDANAPTFQTRAKAYPGLRELGVLQGVGANGIVASICPKQLDDESKADFGYRPAIGAIIDRLKVALGGQCLPRTLIPDKAGHVPCLIIEARKTNGKCSCNTTARNEVSADHEPAKQAAQQDPIAEASGWDCFCEITQTAGAQQAACQNDQNDPPVLGGKQVDGWCYIDATTTPMTGNPKIVEKCPATEQRIVRFVGKGAAQPGATLFVTCSQ